jgi:hypothetical protein
VHILFGDAEPGRGELPLRLGLEPQIHLREFDTETFRIADVISDQDQARRFTLSSRDADRKPPEPRAHPRHRVDPDVQPVRGDGDGLEPRDRAPFAPAHSDDFQRRASTARTADLGVFPEEAARHRDPRDVLKAVHAGQYGKAHRLGRNGEQRKHGPLRLNKPRRPTTTLPSPVTDGGGGPAAGEVGGGASRPPANHGRHPLRLRPFFERPPAPPPSVPQWEPGEESGARPGAYCPVPGASSPAASPASRSARNTRCCR